MSVLVIIEPFEGGFRKQMLSMLSYGKALAGLNGSSVTALCIGEADQQEAQKLADYGVTKLLLAPRITTEPLNATLIGKWIAEKARAEQSTVIIFSQGFNGRALSGVVAASLNASLATGVFALPQNTDPFEVKKNVFSGKAIATIQLNNDIKVLTLQANSFEIQQDPADSFKIVQLEDSLPADNPGIELISKDKQGGSARLTEAEIVVSGGRGMRGPENWGALEELAGLLGAATACSRPVSDEGWRPHSEHVGQTGKIIAPRLYIALGISGAIQHLAGVRGSKVIVAVNKDPEATLFQAADYGVIGDHKEVLPRFIEEVKKIKG